MSNKIPLEDSIQDILGKAQRGLKISNEDLTREAGVPLTDYEQLREGQFNEGVLHKVAPVLKLSADKLITLGKKEWHPNLSDIPPGLAQTNTIYEDMTVNAYLVWDPTSKEAAFFDTGADAAPALEILHKNQLKPKYIFLTHTHIDHVVELPNLIKATGLVPLVHKNEVVEGAKTFNWGETFPLGKLKIEARQTTGHAVGGTTFVVTGLRAPVAIDGDAIFAGSMGGGAISYQDALKTNRQNIFSLPDETILCPGHGPLTTVGLEKRHNPFYPEL